MGKEYTNPDYINIAREEFRGIAALVPGIMQQEDPRRWYRDMRTRVHAVKRGLNALPEESSSFLRPIVEKVYGSLREESRSWREIYGPIDLQSIPPEELPALNEEIGLRADMFLMGVSREMAANFESSLKPVKETIIPLEELLASHPDQLRSYQEQRGSMSFTMFGIKHPYSGEWHDFILPFTPSVLHKGGAVRAALDVFADARPSMVASELPFNDFDAVFVGDEQQARHEATLMGVDPDGAESAGESFDFTKFCNGRDTTQNQICLGRDGLHFSDAAYSSAKTGHTEIVGLYIANKAIYGIDQLYNHGIPLVKPRGLMRLVKAVAEGKAITFGHRDLNKYQDIGLYSIFLAKKWQKREDFGILLQNEFELLKQMGQVREGEKDIYDMLTRAHHEYPFFDIDSYIKDICDVARWKSRKFARQLDREWGWFNSVPSGVEYPRHPGDTDARIITLNGFTSSPAEADKFVKRWPSFVNDCRIRTKKYNGLGVSIQDRLFYTQEVDILPDEEIEL